MEEKRKGFYDLCNLINKHKRKVTLSEIIQEVCNEGWYNDFKRIGYNSVIRRIKKHNEKYGESTNLAYASEFPYDDI